MCRKVSANEKLEYRLEELEKNVDVNQAVQDFADEKMQEQIDLLKERVAELEEKLGKVEQNQRNKPQKERTTVVK